MLSKLGLVMVAAILSPELRKESLSLRAFEPRAQDEIDRSR